MHCRVGTDGEAFHPNLDPQPFDAIFLKGEHQAAYSGFEGRERRRRHPRQLAAPPRGDQVDICGLATDHCVRATALDAVAAGFTTRVLPTSAPASPPRPPPPPSPRCAPPASAV